MNDYSELIESSVQDPQAFWLRQAQRIEWRGRFSQVLDDSAMPFAKWFVGGATNLCHNAVDRHLAQRAAQAALICASLETGAETSYSYRELHREVNTMAAIFIAMGVKCGDRVLIYLPMVAEAVFAMLACARIGAVHSVVFGGFAAASLAARIDDAQPALIVCADAGFQNGKAISYKGLMDEALQQSASGMTPVLMVDRGITAFETTAGRDRDYAQLRAQHRHAQVPCVWLESNAPSYILYTSGTTGKPKGVQRDTGGHAVALAASMEYLFGAQPGDTIFTTSDLGWVVGHSYAVYGPLLTGMTSLLAEGSPTRPDAGAWWRLAEKYRVNLMLAAPTAMRLLKRHGREMFRKADLSALRALFLAGEPLDEATAHWLEGALQKPVIDHYWQTETGSPMLALPMHDAARRPGSPGLPAPGFRIRIVDAETGATCPAGTKGLLVAEGALPPGCLSTLWRNDDDYRNLYWSRRGSAWQYSTFDWAVSDDAGHIRVLGRSDDVINVAGKRLGTREIEEVMLADEAVSEIAVVGMPHALRGQIPIAFVVLKPGIDPAAAMAQGVGARLIDAVGGRLGMLARPKKVVFVTALPRTRSGKVLRRIIQNVIADENFKDLKLLELQAVIDDLATAIRTQNAAGEFAAA
jgi:propionyl-CoA synthetase